MKHRWTSGDSRIDKDIKDAVSSGQKGIRVRLYKEKLQEKMENNDYRKYEVNGKYYSAIEILDYFGHAADVQQLVDQTPVGETRYLPLSLDWNGYDLVVNNYLPIHRVN